MILAGVFRRCTFIADYFPGEPGQRTVPSIDREYRSGGQFR